MSEQYPINTRVAARVKGFPLWPARVADENEAPLNLPPKRSDNSLLLNFYGTNDYCWATTDAIKPFSEYIESVNSSSAKSKRKHRAKLTAAIQQASQDVGGTGDLMKPLLPPAQFHSMPMVVDDDGDSRPSSPALSLPSTHSHTHSQVTGTSAPRPPRVEEVVPISRPDEMLEISISNVLKEKLLFDWDHICVIKMLVPLPAHVTVEDVLVRKWQDARKAHTASPAILENDAQFVQGMLLLFDKCLGTLLLYKFERLQYLELLRGHPAHRASQLYGAEHLLRFLVKLPVLWQEMHATPVFTQGVQARVLDLLRLLDTECGSLFAAEYDNPAPVYRRLAG
eukprot:GCRY01007101.1.p1 GENE.GCRY01007101.1~~GCRY01007101.1.p1  ORF type:complete len:339 (+),score=99.09 GCRY01007101.1:144-1160(+)